MGKVPQWVKHNLSVIAKAKRNRLLEESKGIKTYMEINNPNQLDEALDLITSIITDRINR